MSDDADPLYEPKLATSLAADDAGSGQAPPNPKKGATSKGKSKGTTKGKPANKRPHSPDGEPADPIEDEPATDDGNDDALSGDA